MARCLLLLAGVALLAALAAGKGTRSAYWGEYNTTSGPEAGKINIHLVPHTHDDTGWLVTVDQYYQTEVHYILATLTKRLKENPDRKFIYVETGFFERWWIQAPEADRADFRALVANGQMEFINGGWCMHDEAAPHYVEMVENTARGHQFLLNEFNVTPKGTWQIDPFGHTNTQAWLIGQYAGLQFLYFGRMDYQDFQNRKNLSDFVAPDVPKSLEWVWQGSKTFGEQYQTFTGELYGTGNGGYGAPANLDFDKTDNQIQDDPRFHDYNLDAIIDQAVRNAQDQAAHIRTEHIMWAMGSDFNYQNADHWYHNLDKLIHHLNLNGTVNAFYSTPSIYTEAKNKEGQTWEARYDDVMPLADNAHHYWSGYFTSRQSLKKYLRTLSNLLVSARQLALMTPSTPCTTTTFTKKVCTDNLEAAVAVTTHHDGLSGTEKQAVADDYSQRMSEGEHETRGMLAEVFGKLTGAAGIEQCYGELGLNISFCTFTTQNNEFSVIVYNPQGHNVKQVIAVPVAGATGSVTDLGTKAAVVSQTVPLTARTKSLSQMYLQFKELNNTQRVDQFTNKATHEIVFVADLKPVGWSSYKVQVGAQNNASHASTEVSADANSISNEFYEVTVDPATGTLSHLKNLKSGVATNFAIDIGFYNSTSDGGCTPGVGTTEEQRGWTSALGGRQRREEFEDGMDEPNRIDDSDATKFACDGQSSGAYIFRPNSSTVFPAACTAGNCSARPTYTIVTGALVSEIHVTFTDWATIVVRLVAGQPSVDVEYTVGPIPQANFEGGKHYLMGKEIALRYNTSIASNGKVAIDSNGREMVDRFYNQRGPAYPKPYNISEPVAGNYYSVNTLIGIEDAAAGLQVAVDRSLGGASLASGELELMVHRRTEADDHRGVAQPMNETMCGCRDQDPQHIGQCGCVGLTIRGLNRIVLDTPVQARATRRVLSENVNFGPILAFSKATPTTPSATKLSAALPANVKLMTLGVTSPQYNDKVYLRLAHLYEAGEHPELSKPVTVNLAQIFGVQGMTIKSATERSLTGNRTPQQLAAAKLQWKVAGAEQQMPQVEGCTTGASCTEEVTPLGDDLTVTLRPMDIRTFIVDLA